MVLDKNENENNEQYLWRIKQLKDSNVLQMSWEELTPVINENCGFIKATDNLRKEVAIAKRYKENVFDKEVDGLKNSCIIKADILKKQAQTKNQETNKWLREHARDKLIVEEIDNAISKLSSIELPSEIHFEHPDKVGLLAFGDAHFGTQFTIYGLDGEVINQYNDKIFYDRMWKLFNKTIQIVKENNLSDIYVFDLGDFIDGVLRTSQLMKMQYGLIESTVKYANFLCDWLNELTKYVCVEFRTTPGNHSELRLLGQPKGTFVNENLDIILREFVKIRLKDNPNFSFKENPTGYIFENIFGYNVFGAHGDFNTSYSVIKDFSNTYNRKINYFLAAHKHHGRNFEAGIDTEFIGIPSIIGVDSYSIGLNATSNPAATFLLFEEGQGKTVQYTIKLK